jgi:hypothetical protein
MSDNALQLRIRLVGTMRDACSSPQRVTWEASFIDRPDLSTGDGSTEEEARYELFRRNMAFFNVSNDIERVYPKGYRYHFTPSAIFA